MERLRTILNKSFPYLDSTGNKLLLIGTLIVFSFTFLKVYTPFDMNQWAETHYVGYVVIGACMLLISQFFLRFVFGHAQFKVWSFLLWVIFEVFLITLGIHLAYAPSYTGIGAELHEFYRTSRYVTLLHVGPYLLVTWYLGIRYRFSSIEEISYDTANANTIKPTDDLLTLTGENAKIILAIKYSQLLYIKSSGNYLEIYYRDGDTTVKELVRMSLKSIISRISDPSIIRIHRSFLVNKNHISSFKRTRKGYEVLLQGTVKEKLPVAAGYKENFENELQLKASR
ncbi:MAG: LytTR family DNA-binding domain-containing protein [Bacteroidota bacterium]